MLIDLKEIIDEYKINIKGVIHLGAHKGEEIWTYKKNKISNLLIIEANPKLCKILKLKSSFYNFFFKMNISLENSLITNENNVLKDFNITNNSQCSSVLDLAKHSEIYPEIKIIKRNSIISNTLNYLFEKKYTISNFNFINMDIQGSELLALKGSTKILQFIDAIYTEINFEELYKNCALASELDYFLGKYNFKRVVTVTPNHPSWGDALYIKKNN
jgi:FkbM family methyltransferase